MISGSRMMSWNQRASWPIGLTCSCKPIWSPRGWPMPAVGAVRGGAAGVGGIAGRGRRGGTSLPAAGAGAGARRAGAGAPRQSERALRHWPGGRLGGRAGRQAECGGDGGKLENNLHLNPCKPPGSGWIRRLWGALRAGLIGRGSGSLKPGRGPNVTAG